MQFNQAKDLAAEGAIDDALIESIPAMSVFMDLQRRGEAATLEQSARDSLLSVLRAAHGARRILVRKNASVRTVAFHPIDHALVAYGAVGGTVQIAGIDSDESTMPPVVVCDKEGTVYSVAFNPQGTLLAAGCSDGTVGVWSTSNWKRRSRWQAHIGTDQALIGTDQAPTGTYRVAFNKDGSAVASGGKDSTIKIMRLTADGSKEKDEPEELRAMSDEGRPKGGVWSLAFSPTEDLLLAGDGEANLWRCSVGGVPKCNVEPMKDPYARDSIQGLTFGSNGLTYAARFFGGRVLLWDPNLSPDKPIEVKSGGDPIFSVALVTNQSKGQIAVGHNRQLEIYPAADKEQAGPANIGRLPMGERG